MSEKIPVDTAIGNVKTHSMFISHNLKKPTVNTPQDQAFYRDVSTNVEIFRQQVRQSGLNPPTFRNTGLNIIEVCQEGIFGA